LGRLRERAHPLHERAHPLHEELHLCVPCTSLMLCCHNSVASGNHLSSDGTCINLSSFPTSLAVHQDLP
jgi:hypothetical protein